MSRLLFRSVSSKVEFKEDYIQRTFNDHSHITEIANKRFEGIITIDFTSSGDLEGWTKEMIAQKIGEFLINDHISL